MIHGAAAQLAMLLMMGLLAGGCAVFLFVTRAVLAQLLIQVVNYLEHWGIQRGSRTRTRATDSWESQSLFTQFALLGLARHADHHLKATPALPAARLACPEPVYAAETHRADRAGALPKPPCPAAPRGRAAA